MLYLVDKPMADIAFRTAAGDPDARIVLIQDGVLLNPEVDAELYAVQRDVSVRGVDLDSEIESIDYDTLIEMVFEYETKNFV